MLGQRLRELRLERGWTLDQLAKTVGRTKGTISEIENDKSRAGRQLVEKLSLEFGVTTDYLLGLSDNKEFSMRKELEEVISDIETLNEKDQLMIIESIKGMIRVVNSK